MQQHFQKQQLAVHNYCGICASRDPVDILSCAEQIAPRPSPGALKIPTFWLSRGTSLDVWETREHSTTLGHFDALSPLIK